MRTLFISDLHLDAERPEITALFVWFLADQAAQADALYILGDLFEAWIGDDDDAALATQVAAGLRRVAEGGVPVAFIRGNRDFLLGRSYAARAGVSILPDPCVVTLYEEPVLLLHGDLLCSDDTAYLAVRRQVREPAWQDALLRRTLAERRAFAQQARGASAATQAAMSLDIGDATQHAVDAMFRQFGVRRMVHGHTHRPAVHDTLIDRVSHQRVVLGDWYEQGSVLRWERTGEIALSQLG